MTPTGDGGSSKQWLLSLLVFVLFLSVRTSSSVRWRFPEVIVQWNNRRRKALPPGEGEGAERDSSRCGSDGRERREVDARF